MQKNQFAVQEEEEDNVAAAATTDPKTKFEAEIPLETQQLWQICKHLLHPLLPTLRCIYRQN